MSVCGIQSDLKAGIRKRGQNMIIKKVSAIFLAICFSWGSLCAQQNATITTEQVDWLRGAGKDLQLRIRGEINDPSGNPVDDCVVEARLNEFDAIDVKVTGSIFEIWLPVNAKSVYLVLIDVRNADETLFASEAIQRYNLRDAAIKGFKIQLAPPGRVISVKTIHQGQPVAKALVQLRPTEIGRTDENGIVRIPVSKNRSLSRMSAWAEGNLVGGYQFGRAPFRDPMADEHTIELFNCRDKVMRPVDVDTGKAVPDVKFEVFAATPPPTFNYFGQRPEFTHLISDQNGEAVYKWLPDWESFHIYIDVPDPNWVVLQNVRNVDGALEFDVKRSKLAQRKKVTGKLLSDKHFLGGILVEIRSFQGETERRSDALSAFTDDTGQFEFDALPNSRYCLYVNDKKLVTKVIDLIPYDAETGEINQPVLEVVEGKPFHIVLTSGPNKTPLANKTISLAVGHEFEFVEENGRKATGHSGRRWMLTTDEYGRASSFAMPGELNVKYDDGEWKTEQTFQITENGENTIEIHCPLAEARTINGKLILGGTIETDLNDAFIKIVSVDGQAMEEKTVSSKADGSFSFMFRSNQLALFAYTLDGKASYMGTLDASTNEITVELQPTVHYHGQLLGEHGEPVTGCGVYAQCHFRKYDPTERFRFERFNVRSFETSTDDNGNYTLKNLPTGVVIEIRADSKSDPSRPHLLGTVYLEPNDDRPLAVSSLAAPNPTNTSYTLERWYDSRLNDCGLNGFRLMVISAGDSDQAREFVKQNLLNYEANEKVSFFMDLQVRGPTVSDTEVDREFAKGKNWPEVDKHEVFVCIIDSDGKVMERAVFDVSDESAKDEAVALINKNAPPIADALKKWDEAFAVAKGSNRKVWVRISQRYCGPCFLFSRWIGKHEALLEKDYVMLKIDDFRDENGVEVADRLLKGRHKGIPFSGIFDASGKLLIDSDGPLGNFGFPSSFEGKRHLRNMIKKTRTRITDDEIGQLIDAID
jgi:hypothetical protein